ncbi:P-loop containing nucleoside triphosphate hydrolase protein [Dimargaris cristalligena]|uniref:Kinesin-like protein n=1 Tax=Dimargaris cristalligena TaxID=215637 RepID=A0A4Q0A5F7_9FUNG|nr:P-loop containing nucleoside triphosphate hydrolase protein [Dimargaris cristalligena]|eukprot:RKP40470.1 P-loop containing nucleoside triphosphate hydrolase protein [Dimargaris cristalligena]
MRRRNSIAAPAKQTARLSYQGPIGNEFEAKIRVCVRKRPLNSRELNRGETDIVQATGRRSVTVHEPKHHFIFDEVFDETVTNDEMYQRTAQPLVRFIFQGGNATCFAYGQTGSGKTYTMLDPRNGLYVLAASDIFAMHTQPEYQHLTVLVSFYEIYQSQLYDLLNNRKKLHAREDHRQQVCISGLREIEIENVVDLMEVFEFGNSERSTGSTGANADSSRSHAILQIMLKDDRDNDRLHGKFSFIDLAGSERGADRGESDKQTRMEGSEINKSLLALKECIRALDMDKKHTPFRQSKLTQVLKDSLVGNSRTCMIATVTPNISNSEHSLNTLRYTDRVKAIKGERGTSDCRDTDSANTGQGDDEGYDDAHYYGEPDDWDDGDRASHDPPEDYDGDLYYDCEQDTIDTAQRRPTSYRTQPSPNAMEPPVAQRSTAAPSQKVYFDLAEIDEFVKQHRLQIRETSDYCKLETRLVASYTLGASSGPSPQGSLRSHKYYEGDNDGDDAKVLAQMHSAVSYLEQLDEILDKKQNAVVQLRNSIRQLVYSQSQSQNRQ